MLGAIFCGAWVGMHVDDMTPVMEGNSAEFWKHACQVDIAGRYGSPADDEWGSLGCNIYSPQGEWYVYCDQHFHGEILYQVAADEADADLSKVIAAIEATVEPDLEWVKVGLAEWRKLPAPEQTGRTLQREVRQARLEEIVKEEPNYLQSFRADDIEFLKRWDRCQRYSLNAVFEAAWLTGLLSFLGYPWICRSGIGRWAIHLALLPTLVFLPMYLGYSTLTFTSAYPEGGVIYPYFMRLAAWPLQDMLLEWTELELALVSSPKLAILEPLTQLPGPMLCLSGGGSVSPMSAMLAGLILAGGYVAVRVYWRFIRYRWRKTYGEGSGYGA